MAEGSTIEAGSQYSVGVGLIYVFNLIVGTGALTMPAAFQSAGWLVSLITIIILAFFGFVTVTFMIEAMSIANAKLVAALPEISESSKSASLEQITEEAPLLQREGLCNSFQIVHRVEMGKMAALFFNKVGLLLFNLCIIIYLYGDLSIYAVAVPKSLREVSCTYTGNHSTNNETLQEDDLCWESAKISRENAYRLFVAIFLVLLGPFVFFNVQKTKYLQIFTTLARWLAFTLMIVLTIIQLAKGKGQGKPPVGDLAGVPNLFGVCVYSFMCHHSLPSLVTPIKDKSRLTRVLAGDYMIILIFYALLSFTGVFTFAKVEDLYTLNFPPDSGQGRQVVTNVKVFEYFLTLFPVFTLSTNFPIIAITLRNNLQALLAKPRFSRFFNHYLIALLTIMPPAAVALATNKVDFLVGITGSYAGTGIQYAIPACLVLLARREVPSLQHRVGGDPSVHRSPFSHRLWVIVVLLWAVLCVTFVTVNHIINRG